MLPFSAQPTINQLQIVVVLQMQQNVRHLQIQFFEQYLNICRQVANLRERRVHAQIKQ